LTKICPWDNHRGLYARRRKERMRRTTMAASSNCIASVEFPQVRGSADASSSSSSLSGRGGSVGSGGLHEPPDGPRRPHRAHQCVSTYAPPFVRSLGARPPPVVHLRPENWRTRRRVSAADSTASPTASSCARHCERRGGHGGAAKAMKRPEFLAGGRGFSRRRSGCGDGE
jgi:hypothetical protein